MLQAASGTTDRNAANLRQAFPSSHLGIIIIIIDFGSANALQISCHLPRIAASMELAAHE